jgi:S-DNA-T family DNA segregation ATPase FtsK/SpoIIIE
MEKILKSYGIGGKVVAQREGAVLSVVEFKLDEGVKFSALKNLEDDIALRLGVENVRIDRHFDRVIIEYPRERRVVDFFDILRTEEWQKADGLTFVLGEDVFGFPVVKDLAKMPHLLIAGATGAGKSVTLNSILLSLVLRDCTFMLIDVKQVELTPYNKIKHRLISPVITDATDALTSLQAMVGLMEERYTELAKTGKRKSDEIPVVVVIDELADLMMQNKAIELPISRLAQKARAVNIHLIVATQRPTVNVVTGLIKANFPTRIALRTASAIDSRVILDQNGAEKLLGKGDMLFMDERGIERYHGAFIEDETLNMILDTQTGV